MLLYCGPDDMEIRLQSLLRQRKIQLRKRELLEIAERCYWVPENPARNFREAVQCQWFVQMFSRLEQKTGAIVSNGRMDQYLYPYYKADKEAGILTDRTGYGNVGMFVGH